MFPQIAMAVVSDAIEAVCMPPIGVVSAGLFPNIEQAMKAIIIFNKNQFFFVNSSVCVV